MNDVSYAPPVRSPHASHMLEGIEVPRSILVIVQPISIGTSCLDRKKWIGDGRRIQMNPVDIEGSSRFVSHHHSDELLIDFCQKPRNIDDGLGFKRYQEFFTG